MSLLVLFKDGPLDGALRDVDEQVQCVIYPERVLVAGYEWDWLIGGYVWVGPGPQPDPSIPPATYRNLVYRREGEGFRLESADAGE